MIKSVQISDFIFHFLFFSSAEVSWVIQNIFLRVVPKWADVIQRVRAADHQSCVLHKILVDACVLPWKAVLQGRTAASVAVWEKAAKESYL